jgi:type I restriction enzyme M protein
LAPGRYVGIKAEEDETPFEEKMRFYSEEISKLLIQEEELTRKLREVFNALGFRV